MVERIESSTFFERHDLSCVYFSFGLGDVHGHSEPRFRSGSAAGGHGVLPCRNPPGACLEPSREKKRPGNWDAPGSCSGHFSCRTTGEPKATEQSDGKCVGPELRVPDAAGGPVGAGGLERVRGLERKWVEPGVFGCAAFRGTLRQRTSRLQGIYFYQDPTRSWCLLIAP